MPNEKQEWEKRMGELLHTAKEQVKRGMFSSGCIAAVASTVRHTIEVVRLRHCA